MTRATWILPPLLLLGACGDVKDPDDDNEVEVITTVQLLLEPTDGTDATTFTWADPENDGAPVIDDLVLADATDYVLRVSFLNELEDPAEDITAEVEDESDQHQVFFTGSAVQGPATGTNPDAVVEHAYGDLDANGNPIGLDNTLVTLGTGSGQLTVTLRHLPPESGADVKVSGLAETVASDGFGAIGGDDDASVTFPLTVE
jgi:hypothetical protein